MIITGIGCHVQSFARKEADGPGHVKGTGDQDGLLPALALADLLGKSGVFCRIAALVIHKDFIFRYA